MTDWDDGDPGDIDTLADEAYAAADQERKRLRENRPMQTAAQRIHELKGMLAAAQDALRDAYPYVNGVALDHSNSPWRIETARDVLARIDAALANEREADAEHNQRGDE